ncbi:MAG: hypothetical protein DGJ47_000163 [Rickettsiaceae bacterium]
MGMTSYFINFTVLLTAGGNLKKHLRRHYRAGGNLFKELRDAHLHGHDIIFY